MKHISFRLLACLALIVTIAAPAALYAEDAKVYADSTGLAGDGTGPLGGPKNPVPINTVADFTKATDLLPNKTGILIYISKTTGVQWCKYNITDGAWGPPYDCTPGIPSESGLPVASATWWVLGGLLAVALVAVGFVFRFRSAARA